jgi:beta-glucosidase/6-phospho-beta-glucosidase/beta-galactosidase
MIRNKRLFRSFWIAGFECSTHINAKGVRLDMTAAIQHDKFCAEDYRRLREVGILCARDGLRWHLIDHGGTYDWSSWIPMLEAARREGIQVIWDLFHYGWPDDLDIFSTEFVDRFARFAGEAAQIYREHSDEIAFFSPVNEINFFAWAAGRKLIYPHARGRDNDLKRRMVRADLAAIDSIRAVDPNARFVSPEPLIHNVPPKKQPWNTEPARIQRNSQFEAWDMIAGRTAPELGGTERHLDIVGVNFYAANEWEVPGGKKLHWDAGSDDPRWMPLNELLSEVYHRYRRPLFIAETSHYGIGRAPWLEEVAREIHIALENVPMEGACLYPILDRFDWDKPKHWHNCGLWDLERTPAGDYRRILNPTYAQALHEAQRLVEDSPLELAPQMSDQ